MEVDIIQLLEDVENVLKGCGSWAGQEVMTEQEKTEILDELEARLEKKYKGCLSKEDTQSILKEPRNKWFRDTQGGCSNSLMAEAFDNSIIAWQVWENIRKLTCVICGKQYVRHLEKDDHADEIAEELCQLVYDLRMRQKEEKKCQLN